MNFDMCVCVNVERTGLCQWMCISYVRMSLHSWFILIYTRKNRPQSSTFLDRYRSSVRGIRITVTIHIIGNTHNSLSSHVI